MAGMLAARYDTTGSEHGRIRIVETEQPVPGDGEVLVRVCVSGVNPTDWKSRKAGGQGMTSAGFGWIIPNQDGAGIVEDTGPGVDHARVGEPVWLWECQWQRAMGTAAQYIVLPERQAVPLPENATLDQGAGLGIPAMTAHRALFADGSIDGASILVHGGAGAVGQAAIQLAAWAGARVATTVSSDEKAEIARAAGAGLVVNYREEDVAEVIRGWAPHGVDRVVEVAVDENLELDGIVLAPYGAIATYGAPEGPLPPSRDLIAKNARLQFVLVYTMPDDAKHDAVVAITRALEEDALQPLPIKRFPLEETEAAHEAVEAGFVGKVLIDVPQEPDPDEG
jgi:NADPH:quinone reductase